MQPIGTHGSEVMYFGCVSFRGELGFLNCDTCMCVVNKQFELLKFVFDSVYFDSVHVYVEWIRGLGLGFTNLVGTGEFWTCGCVLVAVVWVV